MTQEDYQKQLNRAIAELKKLKLYQLDSDRSLLAKAFSILYEHEIFTLYRVDISLHNEYKFILFSTLTKYSGSLAFLSIQILAAHAIMNKNTFLKKEFYFKKSCGIAINHLRASVTVISATKVQGGYELQGKLTWASGFGIFDTLLIGFHHDNKEYEVITPFNESENFIIGEPSETFVGNSMATVNIELKKFFVYDEDIVSSKPLGNYNHTKAVSKTIHFALYGLAIGAIELLHDREIQKSATKTLEKIKQKFLHTEEGIVMEQLRIELFFLLQEIITTGMVLYGGKSILIEEQLQRYYRELIMFNSNGLNSTIKGLFKEKFLNK